ncbi:MAG TPA: bifunctional precorrin-2 dehydrogenase/sirohydrochlorin ferrochelatase [Syntrophomonadaceae bacterium]|nr:bifunctional precorrin-2 dehydrogenase/sirohydrochlorin ferrochelatase [Syntrophomonadaceae bacterium]HPR93613.1 bifunctional precorrin-2 dehydrogenase/sirohydrochlorin ferrochelatase [Syntrophomonadaceae bacterium]
MHLFPICISLQNKQCLVIGGGQVALRKVENLLEYEAEITVVSPRAENGIEMLAQQGVIIWHKRNFAENDLLNVFLVFIATDDNSVNQYIGQLCSREGILVNAVDDPPNCDFYVPSVIRRGSLVVAVSTEGKSPLYAQKLRRELEDTITEAQGRFVDLLGEQREIIKTRIIDIDTRQEIYKALVNSDVLDLLTAGEEEKARERIRECMSFWLD